MGRLPSQGLIRYGEDSETKLTLVPEQNLYRGATPRAYPDLENQFRITSLGSDGTDSYRKLPPEDMKNEMLESPMITHFNKNFDNEQKYSGEPFSSLDDAETIFFDICWHAQIKLTQVHTVFED